MTESDVYKKLYTMLHSLGWMLQRIECGAFAPSVPDVWIKPPGYAAFWCELKVVPNFTSKTIRPKWRPGQVAWGRRCVKAGGEWRIIMGCPTSATLGWSDTPQPAYTRDQVYAVTPECLLQSLTWYGGR